MTDQMTICGLFEWELVEKGLMKVGRCRDCFHYDTNIDGDGNLVLICDKTDDRKVFFKEKTDCPDWTIDTR